MSYIESNPENEFMNNFSKMRLFISSFYDGNTDDYKWCIISIYMTLYSLFYICAESSVPKIALYNLDKSICLECKKSKADVCPHPLEDKFNASTDKFLKNFGQLHRMLKTLEFHNIKAGINELKSNNDREDFIKFIIRERNKFIHFDLAVSYSGINLFHKEIKEALFIMEELFMSYRGHINIKDGDVTNIRSSIHILEAKIASISKEI